MKKRSFFAFGLTVLILALVMAGCSRADPKALAKQTYDLTMEAMANPLKAAGSLAKAASLGRKVAKLSPEDKQIYDEELARLTGSGEGGIGILNGLLGADSSSLLNGLLGADSASLLNGLLGADSASINEAMNAILEVIGTFSSSINSNGNGTDTKQ